MAPLACGVLLSGGLDSCILLAHLLSQGRIVQPFYIRSDLSWEDCEQASAERFLAELEQPALRPLKVLSMPMADVYGEHWSLTGKNVPDESTPDEAVYLPGRNALLTIKAALWCQLHSIEELALATLRGNPFADASDSYFTHLNGLMQGDSPSPLAITRPFASFTKSQVMQLGMGYPLEHTFSCIAPEDSRHCGACNKCGERRRAFAILGRDPTVYSARVDLPR